MRTVYWLFAVSVALFIGGIGFIVAGAREARDAPPAPAAAAPPAEAVATVKQLMVGIIAPSAAVVFDSVATIVSKEGIEELQPRTDEEWARVGSAGAALIEAASLLVVPPRAVDQGDWVMISRAMAASGQDVLKATEARDPAGILAAGETLNESCDNCHQQYQRQ